MSEDLGASLAILAILAQDPPSDRFWTHFGRLLGTFGEPLGSLLDALGCALREDLGTSSALLAIPA